MTRDLIRAPAPADWLEPALPAGVRLTPVARPAIDLAPAFHAAFPPDHPDYGDIRAPKHPEDELEDLVSGSLMGPLLACSALAVGEGGDVVGAILVNGQAGEPPLRGPWILEVFRRPDAPGVGDLRRARLLRGGERAQRRGLLREARGPRLREALETRS
jgi:hypothetical protein